MSTRNLPVNLALLVMATLGEVTVGLNATATAFPLGFYTWGLDIWTDPNSDFLKFVKMSAVQRHSPLGDVWFGVGSDGTPGEVLGKDQILPFLKEIRPTAKGVLYITYGDFGSHNEQALLDFIDNLFDYLKAQSQADLKSVAPFGISLDIENEGMQKMVMSSLQKLQAYKKKYLSFLPEGDFLIQQVVGGYPDSGTTGFTMDNADSALYLVYRSYMTDKSDMELNPGNNLLARFKWFMELQCIQCLNPGYKPRAKISVLVEGACYIGEYCGLISFCGQNEFGVENLLKTFEEFDTQAKAAQWIPKGRFDEMMADPVSRYGIHDWHWSRCLYDADVSGAYPTCGTPLKYGTSLCKALHKTPQT
ncbi:hypothetical protein Pmar_PMAR003386 [Perkinsus marinus ATCC 50983]|uniref:GH18 domain-containing protein n=1 Tax=Perkinsus marinus (strain ATCC 50983 / TXsc) TaxID=423536 RepID=C5KH66_PERM5|nr:hypothetical protein Pmar_PMAR003386 [Perkinsus marinus ATCC 50983]EER15928.1 hypothetical protein Pmar_PMAR003386 [Perkinsus marinus ATCC 50983]|eukprot:XP_002784132.1 hypothetical protein Pmar_PMAR003386 [Perkinsus marinus ATCC 50983]